MKNETRIKLVQKACLDIYDSVQEKYKELEKLGDSTIKERNEIVRDIDKAIKIYKGVTESNVLYYELEVKKLQKEFTEKYGVKFEEDQIEEKGETNTTEEPTEEKKSSVWPFVGVGVGAATLGALVGAALGANANKNKANNNTENINRVINSTNESVVEETENGHYIIRRANDGSQPAIVISDVEASVDEVVADSLVLGEYGTFFDASDEEQVMARSQYLYDNYYAKFMSKLSQSERDFITVDRIANTIRVMNGHCPVDENGYMTLDANTVDTYGQAFIELTAGIPSSDSMGTVETVPAYLFAEDGSDLQNFIKSYDEVYSRIAEGRNNRNSDEYRAGGKVMAAKYWTEWFLQGMGGNILYNTETGEISYENNNVAYSEELGRLVHYNPETLEIDKNIEVYQVTNPHNFDATTRYFAYQATMARYGSFIKEAEFNQMATICIPACVDYSSKTLEELSIPEIYTAIDEGVWNDIIAKSAGMEVPTEPMLVGFWEALNDQLNFEYNHTNTLKLN